MSTLPLDQAHGSPAGRPIRAEVTRRDVFEQGGAPGLFTPIGPHLGSHLG